MILVAAVALRPLAKQIIRTKIALFIFVILPLVFSDSSIAPVASSLLSPDQNQINIGIFKWGKATLVIFL